jgi:hypothetical protein
VTICANPACGTEFTKQRMGQRVCSPICATRLVKRLKAEKKAKAKLERTMDKKAREALKTLPALHKEAQAAFNALRREQCRIDGCGCVSCGRPLDWGHEGIRTHVVDAGHFRSVGSAPQLRYTSANVWAQCVSCNRYGSGMAIDYRIGLIRRIGVEAVEALEASNEPHKWTKEEVRAIRDESRAALKQLRKGKP